MNAASPSWITGPSLSWAARHGAMYTYDGYLYVLGGWTSSGCRQEELSSVTFRLMHAKFLL